VDNQKYPQLNQTKNKMYVLFKQQISRKQAKLKTIRNKLTHLKEIAKKKLL